MVHIWYLAVFPPTVSVISTIRGELTAAPHVPSVEQKFSRHFRTLYQPKTCCIYTFSMSYRSASRKASLIFPRVQGYQDDSSDLRITASDISFRRNTGVVISSMQVSYYKGINAV